MKGGFRPGSGRKKGSIPWNKGLHTGNNGNGFKKGEKPCNFGTKMPSVSEKMKGNQNGKGNKGRVYKVETLEKMRFSKYRLFTKLNPNYKPTTRKGKIAANGGFHSKQEWEFLKAQYNWTCPCCKQSEPQIKLTKDHIIPLLMGGSNNIENIQPLCFSCNRNKSYRYIRY